MQPVKGMDWIERLFYTDTDQLVLGFHTVRLILVVIICLLAAQCCMVILLFLHSDGHGAVQCGSEQVYHEHQLWRGTQVIWIQLLT